MKKYNNYLLEYQQQAIWDELRPNVEEHSIKDFIESYKSDKEIITNSKYDNPDEIINHFDFTIIAKDVIEEEGEEDKFEYEEFNKDDVEEFIKDTKIKLSETEQDTFDEMHDYIRGEKLYDIFDSLDDFIDWMKEKDYINYETLFSTEYYDNVNYILNHEVEDDKITIYRAMTIKLDGEEHKIDNREQGVGIYWSYEEGGAEAHGGDWNTDRHLIVLKAKIHINNVDWERTFYKSVYSLSDEREIETKDDITVELTGYMLPDTIEKYVDIKMNDIDRYKSIKKFKDYPDYKFIRMFRQEAEEKYNVEFDEPINIIV